MASTYSTNLAIELIGTGDQAGSWGNTTNTNLGTLIEQAISGYVTQAVSTGTDTTITIPNGATGVARNMYIELTGTGGTNTNLIVPANKKLYFIFNNTTGAVTVKVSGQTGVSVPQGKKVVLTSNGTDIVNGLNYIADFGSNSATITQLTATSATITNLTLTSLVISSLSIASANITTLTSSSATISTTLALSGGTANGVLYLNGSKVATSGSALTFNGTTLVNTGPLKVGDGAASNTSRLMVNNATNTATGIQLFQDGIESWIMGMPANSAGLAWSASGAEQMRLNSTGLGIGTSSPGYKLDVNGQARLGGTAGLFVGIGTAFSSGQAEAYTTSTTPMGIGTVGAAPLRFYTNSNFNAVLDSSGNLGIGTSSPASRLNVLGSTDCAFFSAGSASYFALGLSTANGNRMYLTTVGASDESLKFVNAGGSELMRLTASGNLGIGTSSPVNKLDVQAGFISTYDPTNANGAGYSVRFYTNANSGSRAEVARFGGLQDGAGNNGQLVFSTSTSGTVSEKMSLNSSGNLGLGVTPSAWRSTEKAMQIGQWMGLFSDSGLTAELSSNMYISSGNQFVYTNTGAATRYRQYLGAHSWFTAASGTAGNTITFTQAMTLTAGGNLLLGTTGDYANLLVGASSNFPVVKISRTDASYNTGILALGDGNSTTNNVGIWRGAANSVGAGGNVLNIGGYDGIVFTASNAALGSQTERARITSGGNLLVGGTADHGRLTVQNVTTGVCLALSTPSAVRQIFWIPDGYYGYQCVQTIYADGGKAFIFNNAAGTEVGTIVVNNASTAYNTTSDYRLKDEQKPLTGSGAFIDAIKPKEWVWKTNGERGVGLIAHELADVSPSSVSGEKDGMRLDKVKDENGEYVEKMVPNYQSVSYSSGELIANLIAEVQSLRKRVAELETK